MFFALPQLIALVFGIIVIAKILTDYKKKKENWQMVFFWVIVWLVVIIAAFIPNIISQTITRLSNRTTTIGQIIGSGFVFVLFIVYRVYAKAQRLEKQLNELVRKLALRELKRGKK